MTGQLDKRRVVKNTIVLYVRMFVLMIIGFLTTRIIFRSLGEVDYGLNNAVAGFIALFGILTNSLNAAISRFITYELGRGNHENLNKVFSTSLFIQMGMALILALLVETVGVWFLNNHMTIPVNRLVAARWVLHFAVINTFVTLTFVPYSAAIISHEKMSIYAFVSIAEGGINLLIAYLLTLDTGWDKWIVYSGLLCVSSLFINIIYRIYCVRSFEECRMKFLFDKSLLKSLGNFAGWNMFGAAAGVLRDQGTNILFNIFFGPIVNAAKGISNHTSSIATRFSSGFMQALNPQITKSYASGDFTYMYSLLFQGTRLGFILFYLIALPIFVKTDALLTLWLGSFPVHTVPFIRIAIIMLLFDNILGGPLVTLMLATGKIRNYQIVVGGLLLINFPLAYILLLLGFSPEFVMTSFVSISVCCMAARLIMLHKMIGFPITTYFKDVVSVIFNIILLSSSISFIVNVMISENLLGNLFVCLTSFLSVALLAFSLGLTKSERKALTSKIKSIFMPLK